MRKTPSSGRGGGSAGRYWRGADITRGNGNITCRRTGAGSRRFPARGTIRPRKSHVIRARSRPDGRMRVSNVCITHRNSRETRPRLWHARERDARMRSFGVFFHENLLSVDGRRPSIGRARDFGEKGAMILTVKGLKQKKKKCLLLVHSNEYEIYNDIIVSN